MSTEVAIETGQERALPRVMQVMVGWLQGVSSLFAAAAEEQS